MTRIKFAPRSLFMCCLSELGHIIAHDKANYSDVYIRIVFSWAKRKIEQHWIRLIFTYHIWWTLAMYISSMNSGYALYRICIHRSVFGFQVRWVRRRFGVPIKLIEKYVNNKLPTYTPPHNYLTIHPTSFVAQPKSCAPTSMTVTENIQLRCLPFKPISTNKHY